MFGINFNVVVSCERLYLNWFVSFVRGWEDICFVGMLCNGWDWGVMVDYNVLSWSMILGEDMDCFVLFGCGKVVFMWILKYVKNRIVVRFVDVEVRLGFEWL